MHFKVGVITENGTAAEVYELLDKYDENRREDAYIIQTKAEFIAYYRGVIAAHLNSQDYADFLAGKTDKNYPDRLFKGMRAAMDADDESFHKFCIDVYDIPSNCINEKGDLLEWGNPDGRYDYCSIGGRFSNHIVKKDGSRDDLAKFEEINFKLRREIIAIRSRYWDRVVLGKTFPKDPNLDMTWGATKETLLKKYQSKEAYLESFPHIIPPDIVRLDGEWVDKNSYLPEDSSGPHEYYQEYLALREVLDEVLDHAKQHPNHYFVIVDCHC